jgi:opacity protein-like surface antigen
MKLPTLMVALGLLGLPGVANCDGLPSRSASNCCDSPTWTGIYAGFYAGGAWADTDWTFPFVETYNSAPGQHFSTSPQGAIVGMQAGINYQMGVFLVGAETSFAGANMVETLTGPVTALLPSDRLRTEITNLFTVTGRLGVATDQWLLYGKGGYANSNVDVKALSGSSSPVPGVTANANRSADGWVVGGGVEYRLRRSLVLGLEYSYVDLGTSRLSTITGGAAPGGPFNVDLGDAHFQTVTVRLSILLDTNPTAPTK